MSRREQRRCAIYTRKSSEEGLEQSFNSLDAQREACEAYIKSQAHEGWTLVRKLYDDGGFSGGSMDRPGLRALLADIDRGLIDIVVVYKVDRLTRSLMDFARIVDVLDKKGASFVSVTQQFNTTTSMGRLTLNVLLSFAQFEREVTGERIRDKVAASKSKGMWMGGFPPLGYDILNRKLAINEAEAATLRSIFERFLELRSVRALVADLRQRGIVSKRWKTRKGPVRGGHPFSRGALYYLLRNRIYLGEIEHKGKVHKGEHQPILPRELWEKVQACLDSNAGERSTAERSEPRYPLAGILFDNRGNRMSPSHVKKKDGRRYRYYVSQALLQHRANSAGSLPRIAAQPIEDFVAHRVDLIVGNNGSDNNRPDGHASLDRLLKVEIARDCAKLLVRLDGGLTEEAIRSRLDSHDTLVLRDGLAEITIPIRVKSWGGEKVIERPDGARATSHSYVDPVLTKAVAQAFHWRELLASGAARSLQQVAAQSGCDESHVRHQIELAFLAPDIVEMIVEGRQPRHITLDRMVRCELPASWSEQRRILGFRPR